jgi:cytochrome c
MKKFIAIVIIAIISQFSYASAYKGQRIYMKICKTCHKSGGKLAKSHTQEEWEKYFADNANLLRKIHKQNSDAMKKIESEKFLKNIKHIRQFFYEYASDTGNVPACN